MKRNLTWYINRLRQMDGAEIRWRIGAELQAVGDLGRITTGTLPNRSGKLPEPNLQLCHPIAGDPVARDRAVFQATPILSDNMSYFDHDEHHVGNPIDWHRDWHSDVHAPQTLSHFIDYRDAPVSGDCKQVWEPNRHHQLLPLARAYSLTGETEYADKVVAILLDWIESNPYGYGMNWRSPLEVGIRAINWTFALDLLAGYSLSNAASGRIHEQLYLHCWDVARKFSKGSSANNHLIGEAAGVFIPAMVYFPDEATWIEESRAILEREIDAQVHPSGCTKEQALNYQFFVIQFFLYSGLTAHQAQRPFSERYWERLAALMQFLELLSGFGAKPPLFGDQDDGYVLDFGAPAHCLENIRAWTSALRDGNNLTGIEPRTVLGDQTITPLPPKSPFPTSVALDDCGYAVLRASDHQDRELVVLLDGGELGYGSLAAHGHADALQICVGYDNQAVFVDSGTYDYFTYPELRQYYRSTAAHNTIRINETDQSAMSGPFMWHNRAEASLGALTQADGRASVSAQLHTYPTLGESFVSASRQLDLDSDGDLVLYIADTVEMRSEATQVERFFRLHPDVRVEPGVQDGEFILHTANGAALLFRLEDFDQCVAHTTGDLASYSPRYHVRETTTCIVATSQNLAAGPVTLRASLTPTTAS